MIIIKSQKEIDAMREGGKILARVMDELGRQAVIGKNTLELDKLAEELVFASGGTPVFKGYGKESGNPFPGTICISLNHEVVHGIPKADKIIKEGDIVKIDIGMKYKDMITDMARTFAVGKISPQARQIMDVTRESLNSGIEKLRAGNSLSEYSRSVQEYVEKQGFHVIRDLVGHGVGKKLHEDPYIPNYFNKKDKQQNQIVLKDGMTLALEPMVNAGTIKIKLEADGWTYATADGKLSAHFEDTVLITKNGPEILTRIDL